MSIAETKNKKRLIRLLLIIGILIPVADCVLMLVKSEIYLGFTGTFAYIDQFRKSLGGVGGTLRAILLLILSAFANSAILYILPGLALVNLHFGEKNKAKLYAALAAAAAVLRSVIVLFVLRCTSEPMIVVGCAVNVLLTLLLLMLCLIHRRPTNVAALVIALLLIVVGLVAEEPTAALRAYEEHIGDQFTATIGGTTSSVENKSYSQIVSEADTLVGLFAKHTALGEDADKLARREIPKAFDDKALSKAVSDTNTLVNSLSKEDADASKALGDFAAVLDQLAAIEDGTEDVKALAGEYEQFASAAETEDYARLLRRESVLFTSPENKTDLAAQANALSKSFSKAAADAEKCANALAGVKSLDLPFGEEEKASVLEQAEALCQAFTDVSKRAADADSSYKQIANTARALSDHDYSVTFYVQKAYKYIAEKMERINDALGEAVVIGENRVTVERLDSTGVPYFQISAKAMGGLGEAFKTMDTVAGKGFIITTDDSSSVISSLSTFFIKALTYCAKLILLIPFALLWVLCTKPGEISDSLPRKLHGFATAFCRTVISLSILLAIVLIIYTYISSVDVMEQAAVIMAIVLSISAWLSAFTMQHVADSTAALFKKQVGES